MTNKELDKLLKSRRVPPSPEGLSARIIAAAHRADDALPVQKPLDIAKGWIEKLAAKVQSLTHIPQPAYVAAGVAVFIIGAVLGMNADGVSLLNGLSVGDVASFMVINDSFVVAEWV